MSNINATQDFYDAARPISVEELRVLTAQEVDEYTGKKITREILVQRRMRSDFIVCLRNSGYTLQQIGERLSITRERVR